MPYPRRGILADAIGRSWRQRVSLGAAAAPPPSLTVGTSTIQNLLGDVSGTSIATVPSHNVDDLLILTMGINQQDVAGDTCVITQAGWTELAVAEQQVSTGSAHTQRVYTKIGDGSESTATLNLPNFWYVNIGITPISGYHPDYWDVIPAAGHVKEQQNSSNPTAAAITTQVVNSIVYLSCCVTSTYSTYGAPAGYTDDANNSLSTGSLRLCTKEVAAAGLETPGAWECTGVSGTAENLLVTLSIMPRQVDPYWSDVVLLLNWQDGADASTDFYDYSRHGWPVLANAGAQVDTAQSKFGGQAMHVTSAGPGDSAKIDMTASSFPYFDLADGDFTIDLHLRADTSSGADQTFEYGLTGENHIAILQSNNNVFMEHSATGSGYIQTDSGHNVTDDTWHHLALVRNGNDLDLYMDGVKGTTTKDLTGVTLHALTAAANLWIGAVNDSSGGTDGWIDNFRLTKGVARYTEAFDPPTHAYPYEPFDISRFSTDGAAGDVTGDIATWPHGLETREGSGVGGKDSVYYCDDNGDFVALGEYTSGDLSSYVADSNTGDIGRPLSIAVPPACDNIFVSDLEVIYRRPISTPFDMTSVQASDENIDLGADFTSSITDIHFSVDGMHFFACAKEGDVVQYTCATAWTLTGATKIGAFDASAQITVAEAQGMTVTKDGRTLLVSAYTTHKIYEYKMSIPFDITTAYYSGRELALTGAAAKNVNGMSINDAGDIIHIITFATTQQIIGLRKT